MNHSFELDCNEKNLFKILTNYENLSKYLPRKLQKIEILEKNENYTTVNATILLKTLIKKEFSQKLKIEIKSESNLSIEILDGHAKGTHVTISLSTTLRLPAKPCTTSSFIEMQMLQGYFLPDTSYPRNALCAP